MVEQHFATAMRTRLSATSAPLLFHYSSHRSKRAKRGLLPIPSMDPRLAAAASEGRVEDLKQLVKNGADVNLVDNNGVTGA